MNERTTEQQLVAHLQDAHALECHIDRALGGLLATAAAPGLRTPVEEHREVARRHRAAVEDRLRAHRASPAPAQPQERGPDLAELAAVLLSHGRRDHAGKHARDAYLLIQLAIAGYEMLAHLADRAQDEETAAICRHHVTDERATARALDGAWDLVLDLSLGEPGVPGAVPAVSPGVPAGGV